MSHVESNNVIDNTILVKTNSLKYSGVLVVHNLNSVKHISYVRCKYLRALVYVCCVFPPRCM